VTVVTPAEVAERIAQAIEARRCYFEFCGDCSCRKDDAAIARRVGAEQE